MKEKKNENQDLNQEMNEKENQVTGTSISAGCNEAPEADTCSETSPTEESEKKKNKSFFGKKEGKEDKLKEQIKSLNIEKQELNDKFLRLYSEFENYKKRTTKEKLEMLNTASEKVIVNLLPVVDDFERAIKANETVTNIETTKEGFTLIYNKLIQILKRFDVEEIAALGEPFDTDFHEAITHFPAQNEEDKDKVIDVTEKGYKIKDKVVRYAKVVVAN
ncbi:MAG: nucleotide exchange factor GrpE [Bacteroidales bacterium]|jgi:molecular chaperone GrpE|nr:nucleotide exchange factor GrpE [Bacteroidales bacterium]